VRRLALAAALIAGSATAQTSTPAPVPAPAESSRIFIASDSTAQAYGPDRYPQTGWGQLLTCGLMPGTEVVNRAIGGRSTRTFISEGRWDKLIADARTGDIVLIQFGHNDASTNRPERYAPAATAYRDNLLRMIWEAKGRGLIPVLVTPPARRSFEDGRSKADYAAYSAVMRDLIAPTNVPLIDLEARSRALLDRTGEDASRRLYLHYTPADRVARFPDGVDDDTHFSELGGRAMAEIVASELKGLKLPIADRVLADRPDLTRKTPIGSAACR